MISASNFSFNKKTSDRYKTVETSELYSTVSKVLTDSGFGFSSNVITGRRRNNGSVAGINGPKGTRHALEFTIDLECKIGSDIVKPRVFIINSFNGESALTIRVGMFRLICTNGLVIGQTLFSERIIHVQGETVERKLAALAIKVQQAVEWIKTDFERKVAEYTAIQLTLEQELNIVKQLGLSKRATEAVETARLFVDRLRPEDRERNAWTLLNVVNETIRKASRGSEMATLQRNLNLMDRIVDLARAA